MLSNIDLRTGNLQKQIYDFTGYVSLSLCFQILICGSLCLMHYFRNWVSLISISFGFINIVIVLRAASVQI